MPTDDAEVKVRLRELKEPICEHLKNLCGNLFQLFAAQGLFGEGPVERRQRLRMLVAEFGEFGQNGCAFMQGALNSIAEKGVKIDVVNVPASIDLSKLDVS